MPLAAHRRQRTPIGEELRRTSRDVPQSGHRATRARRDRQSSIAKAFAIRGKGVATPPTVQLQPACIPRRKPMAKDHPDHHDAEIVMRLYDLRREAVMRES